MHTIELTKITSDRPRDRYNDNEENEGVDV